LPLENREPNTHAAIDPSMAQFHLWLAQAQRDHGRISDAEMTRMEAAAQSLASRSRVMFNPFTGEIRRMEY
jgi:hypothetical protein